MRISLGLLPSRFPGDRSTLRKVMVGGWTEAMHSEHQGKSGAGFLEGQMGHRSIDAAQSQIWSRKDSPARSASDDYVSVRPAIPQKEAFFKTFTPRNNVTRQHRILRVIYCLSRPNPVELLQEFFGGDSYAICKSISPLIKSLVGAVIKLNPNFNFRQACEYIAKCNSGNPQFLERIKRLEIPKPKIKDELDIISVGEFLSIIKIGSKLEVSQNTATVSRKHSFLAISNTDSPPLSSHQQQGGSLASSSLDALGIPRSSCRTGDPPGPYDDICLIFGKPLISAHYPVYRAGNPAYSESHRVADATARLTAEYLEFAISEMGRRYRVMSEVYFGGAVPPPVIKYKVREYIHGGGPKIKDAARTALR